MNTNNSCDNALHALLNYLHDVRGFDDTILDVRLKFDGANDRMNAKDPRAFCFCVEGENIIHCSNALLDLPAEPCIGILLHELAHLILNAFHGEKAEVDVDLFCTEKIPEAGYHYRDCTYFNSLLGKEVTAKNIEWVSTDFIHRILE